MFGKTIIAKDMDSAINISKKGKYSYKIVTLGGEVINPGGALTGGSIQGKNTNLLGRKREIEELAKSLKEYKQKIFIKEKYMNRIKINIKTLDENILNNKG